MKFFNLIFICVTLICNIAFAYEVKFQRDTNAVLPLYIDRDYKVQLWNCRYNSAKAIYCEASVPTLKFYDTVVVDNTPRRDPDGAYHDKTYKNTKIGKTVMEHYRILMYVDVKNFDSNCKRAFEHSATLSKYTLKRSGSNQNRFADISSYLSNSQIPSVFDTLDKAQYYFRFEKDSCTFDAQFNKVYMYKA